MGIKKFKAAGFEVDYEITDNGNLIFSVETESSWREIVVRKDGTVSVD
jgi:hypothetical protein